MLNGKQLLNKTDTQNFPQKCLFTLRMIAGFINVWMNMVVLLPKFSWSQYKDTHNTSRIFFIEFREWQYEPGRQKQGFLKGAKFSRKWLSVLKAFLFQKENYSLSFGISQFATDCPWENFLVCVQLVGFEPGSFWCKM